MVTEDSLLGGSARGSPGGQLFITQLILIMIINWNDRRRVIHASPVLLPGGIVYGVAYAAALNQLVVNNDYVLFRRVNYSRGVHRAYRALFAYSKSALSRKG